ncbi:MAG TPA: LysR family transcriptional regulator [candidate division Zixibacteria bacterium]|nr:LysR family transcriptional regulator [candidate division Zixibacteria bacterium]
MVDLDHLLVFTTVARHRNISRAAEELHISQPAVTKQLKRLEESYRANFYKKGGRGVELTPAGRVFLNYARAALRQHERLKERLLAAGPQSRPESLTVGASQSPSLALLLSRLTAFKKRRPHVQVSLRTNNRTIIEKQVENAEVDVAVVNKPPSSRSLAAEPYLEEPFVAFVSSRHPLARKRRPSLKDFARVPLVVREGKGGKETSEQILAGLRRAGLNCEIGIRCESPEAVKMAVKRRLGLGILYKSTVEPDIREGVFRRVHLPGLNLIGKSFIVYHRQRPLSPHAREFLALLRKDHEELPQSKVAGAASGLKAAERGDGPPPVAAQPYGIADHEVARAALRALSRRW